MRSLRTTGSLFVVTLASGCSGGGDDSRGDPMTTGLPATPGTTSNTPTTGGPEVTTTAPTTSTTGTAETGTTDAPTSTTGIPDLPPPQLKCSVDLHAVLDEQNQVVETCAPEQGCLDGACVPACDAAAASGANFGCAFIVPTPPSYPPALPPCFAVFLANTWGHPAKISATRAGQPLDLTQSARVATPGLKPAEWPPVPAEGLPADSVAVLFLSSDPNAIMPENLVPLTCPVPDTIGAHTAVLGSGRGAAFELSADIPLTAYDILPFGGARSHFPSAELLFPTSAWGNNYVAIVPPVGTADGPGPLWLQVVGQTDGTTVQIVPTADLSPGPGLLGAAAGQLSEFTVDAGEVLQWELPPGAGDASGTLLLSTQPVALHTGNRFLRLQPMPAPGGEASHQQNSSVAALGNEYVASPYETRRADLAPEEVDYRFVGAVDGTVLSYDPAVPGAPATLARGQIVDFASAAPFRVRSQDPEHPFALAQLMDTANIPGGTRPGATAPGFAPMLGDEEFVVVLPPAQFLQRYAFFTDPTYATTNLVFTRINTGTGFNDVTVDCLGTITGWKPVGADKRYEVATADLVRADVGVNGCTNGHHLAESDGPFGVVVWGLDSYSSYAYPAGGSALALTDLVIPPS
jgi:hypothetical protein